MTETNDPTEIDIYTDPLTQRMSGIAIHGDTPFDVPYISHITGNIYQGGYEYGLILPEFIEHVVSLYKWKKYEHNHELKSFHEYTMYDSEDGIPEREQLDEIVDTAMECIAQGPTLIHCQAGLNRSSLIAGLCLRRLGYTGKGAVGLIKASRSTACLCNKAFEGYILAYERT